MIEHLFIIISTNVTKLKQKQPRLGLFIPKNNENTQELLEKSMV